MWIPTPAYERLPLFLFAVGLLFMSSVLYLGLDHHLTLFYFGTGLGCTAWGIGIFILRRLYRKDPQESRGQTEPVETSEDTPSP